MAERRARASPRSGRLEAPASDAKDGPLVGIFGASESARETSTTPRKLYLDKVSAPAILEL
jgi:hypothetical protein